MNYTAQMLSLLGALRREMNGEMADKVTRTQCCAGHYGLNLGVAIPTIREIARAQPQEHDFAKYLYVQDIRELRMAAVSIADPARVTAAELPFWFSGWISTELCEELALCLLCHMTDPDALCGVWLAAGQPATYRYTALMSLARRAEQLPLQNAVDYNIEQSIAGLTRAIEKLPEDRRIVHGAVCLLSALATHQESRPAVESLLGTLSESHTRAATVICEELAWRL